MKVEFTKRAAADLLKISAESRAFGDAVTAAIEGRIRQIIAHIAARPKWLHALSNGRGCTSFR